MLAVILPALFMSSLHHHEPVHEDKCINCGDHVPHSHLRGVSHTDDCLVCQFLTVLWLASKGEMVDRPIVFARPLSNVEIPSVGAGFSCLVSPRAPPFVFC